LSHQDILIFPLPISLDLKKQETYLALSYFGDWFLSLSTEARWRALRKQGSTC